MGFSRKDYILKPKIAVETKLEDWILIPTIIYVPWKYRYRGGFAVAFVWLNFGIIYGEFVKKEE